MIDLNLPKQSDCGTINVARHAGHTQLALAHGDSRGGMTTPARARYAGYRFPAEIIVHAVWCISPVISCTISPGW